MRADAGRHMRPVGASASYSMQKGKRGGQFYLSKTGRKVYRAAPKGRQPAHTQPVVPPSQQHARAPSAPSGHKNTPSLQDTKVNFGRRTMSRRFGTFGSGGFGERLRRMGGGLASRLKSASTGIAKFGGKAASTAGRGLASRLKSVGAGVAKFAKKQVGNVKQSRVEAAARAKIQKDMPYFRQSYDHQQNAQKAMAKGDVRKAVELLKLSQQAQHLHAAWQAVQQGDTAAALHAMERAEKSGPAYQQRKAIRKPGRKNPPPIPR